MSETIDDTTLEVEVPAPEQVAGEQPPVEEHVAAPADADEAFDADVKTHGVQLPEGEILVPLSSVTTLRQKLKDAKAGSAEAATLKQQLEHAQQQLQAVAPLAEAFKALQQAQHQPPQPVQQPIPEDTSELEEIARDFDFYRADGTPDLDRAKRMQARETKRATEIAQQQTAPLIQHAIEKQVTHNISLALATVHPVTGEKADPQVLGALINQIRQQENGLVTLANPDAMKHVWLIAHGLSLKSPAPTSAKESAKEAPAAPVFTERAGGKMPNQRALSPLEKRAAKDAGMTESEYLKAAADMPWGA